LFWKNCADAEVTIIPFTIFQSRLYYGNYSVSAKLGGDRKASGGCDYAGKGLML
jgi:hypothetical protein